jgi:hypothetical protein
MNTAIRARLAAVPYFEGDAIRCDCFLISVDGVTPTQIPALIQLVSSLTKHPAVPPWKPGDILVLQPTISCLYNDTQETGRCYVELALMVTCEGRPDFLTGMVPLNPNFYDFSADDKPLH